MHLKVPTLGEMMKARDPRTRSVSVAGKDRAAVMMGGHKVDELWWWDGKAFVSYAGRKTPAVVDRTNAAVAALVSRPQVALDVVLLGIAEAAMRHHRLLAGLEAGFCS